MLGLLCSGDLAAIGRGVFLTFGRCIDKAVSAINSGVFYHAEIWEKEELFY